MRNLVIILSLLVSSCCKSQIGLFAFSNNTSTNSPATIGTFIDEQFNGTSLTTDLTAYNTGSHSYSVSGGDLIQTCNYTSSDSLNSKLRFSHTGHGYSALRNNFSWTTFNFQRLGEGAWVGLRTGHPVLSSSSFAVIDIANNKLRVLGGDGSDGFDNIPAQTNFTVTINTTSEYYMSLEIKEDSCILTLMNLTLSQTQQLKFTYGFTPVTNTILRPNKFLYSFGGMGKAIVRWHSFGVSSTEKFYPKFYFFGDSITTGYYGDLATNAYPYKLRPFTSGDIQIMAGGGLNMDDFLDLLPEMIWLKPQYCFLMCGANDGGAFGPAWPKYQSMVTTMTSNGINVVNLLIVNGSIPTSSGTFNYNIINTYPPDTTAPYTYPQTINTWDYSVTGVIKGFSVMTIGNGKMVDGLHPSNSGFNDIMSIIKKYRSDLFPLWILPFAIMGAPVRRMKRKDNEQKIAA